MYNAAGPLAAPKATSRPRAIGTDVIVVAGPGRLVAARVGGCAGVMCPSRVLFSGRVAGGCAFGAPLWRCWWPSRLSVGALRDEVWMIWEPLPPRAVFSVQHLSCSIRGNAVLGSHSDLLGASLHKPGQNHFNKESILRRRRGPESANALRDIFSLRGCCVRQRVN
jgi:hypothetical protein